MVGTANKLITYLIEQTKDKQFELWKDIKNYEGLYQVSNLGRVKRISYHHGSSGTIIHKEKILKPILNKKNGYLYYGLSNNGLKSFRAHKLVLNTFNPNEGMQINHKNGNKQDNRLINLEWCTPKENIQHAYKNGLAKARRNEKNSLSKKVGQFDLDGNLIRVWPSTMQIQRELGYTNTSIGQCCNGKREITHGYKWRYV